MSFIGYDWNKENIYEYIKPLLEKKELNIQDWDEYKKQHIRTKEFIHLFESSDTKSSYNLPVIYQNKIMGYFCLDYTKKTRKLTHDDLTVIRSICTQAGIALYHSELYEKAKEESHAKEDFIANISKELKNPLNKIIELSEKLSSYELTKEEQLEFLKIINENGKHLLELRNDIITISHIESENFKLNYEYIDTDIIFEKTLKTLNEEITQKKIKLETHIEKINANLDKEMFGLLLYDLILNLVKIAPKESGMSIESKVKDYKLEMSFELKGHNVPADERNKIFEKLKQLDTLYSISRQNSGIELLIVKRIIDQHNGIIEVKSSNDHGTILTFKLPNAFKMH